VKISQGHITLTLYVHEIFVLQHVTTKIHLFRNAKCVILRKWYGILEFNVPLDTV